MCEVKGRKLTATINLSPAKWDPMTCTLEDVTMTGVLGSDRFWQDPDILDNGLIVIQNNKGFGVAHAKQHTIQTVIRMRNVLLVR